MPVSNEEREKVDHVENGIACLNCGTVEHEGCINRQCGSKRLEFTHWTLDGVDHSSPYKPSYQAVNVGYGLI
jgi:hypothetical protein